MFGLKEFKTRFDNDAAFRAKFAEIDDAEQAFALAKAEGYDLTQLSDDELDAVAGGNVLNDIKIWWKWITDQ